MGGLHGVLRAIGGEMKRRGFLSLMAATPIAAVAAVQAQPFQRDQLWVHDFGLINLKHKVNSIAVLDQRMYVFTATSTHVLDLTDLAGGKA